MKPLAIFDIDGTLTDTNEIDQTCFVEALFAEYGIETAHDHWSSFPHVTDRAILAEILRRAWQRAPQERELAAHRERFLRILDERMPRPNEIPGAIAFLELVKRDWNIVLCTGAWGASARMKLERAGFPNDLPIASCDDCESREGIVRNGIAKFPGAERIVIFGDGVWDYRAARNLQLPFIGVGRRSGAERAVDDYTDSERVLALMDSFAPR